MELLVLDKQEMIVSMVQVSQNEKSYRFYLCKTEEFLQVNYIDEEERRLSMFPAILFKNEKILQNV
ncbi:hypothetical protein ACFVWC_16405 [Bacillus mycoides]|uniref:hypothetical protein n=1 Tax=Bacillus mycoides TaxID=1405 RepID=UPI0036E09992